MKYTNEVLKHFQNPEFMGEIENADGKGTVGNAKCGDIMEVYIKVGEGEVIEDIKFKTFGCVAAIASSDTLCSVAKGMKIQDALKITKQDVIDAMGGEVPAVKVHCSILASEALEEAVKDYEKKKAK